MTLPSIATIQKALDNGPYNQWLGATVTEFTKDSITLELEGRVEMTNSQRGEVIHGGVISALLDVAACFSVIGTAGGSAPTIDLATHFLRPVTPGKIIVTGRLIKPGRSIAVAEAELRNEGGKVAAITRGTFATSAVTPIEDGDSAEDGADLSGSTIAGLESGNIGDAFNRSRGDEIAFVQTGENPREISYTNFIDNVCAAQARLANEGIGKGDHVALIGLNSIEWLEAFFGIMRAGAVAVPISHKFPVSVLQYVLENSESKLVLADCADRLPEGNAVPFRLLDSFAAEAGKKEELPAPAPVDPADPAMVLYTSGSTGKPKGVVRSHGSHLWIMEQGEKASDGAFRSILVAAPLYHMNGLATVQGALVHGDRIVLQPQFDARGFLQAIADHGVTKLTGVPPMMALALREKDLIQSLDLSSLTENFFGSAPLTEELIADIEAAFPNAKLAISYGTTESGPVAFSPHPDGRPTPKNSVGVAHPAVRVRLLDTDGSVLVDEGMGGKGPAGPAIGNLAVGSPAELSLYLNRPDLARPIDTDGFYRSGDLFRRDEDGFYYFTGRVDDMFVSGGENVHPAAVEAALVEHPGVREAAVVPVADEMKGAKPVAFVVRQDGTGATEEELKAWVLDRMEPYAHPRRVFFTDSFPLSGTNKVDKNALAARAAELTGDQGADS